MAHIGPFTKHQGTSTGDHIDVWNGYRSTSKWLMEWFSWLGYYSNYAEAKEISGSANLMDLSWEDFEHLVGEAFRERGFWAASVRLLPEHPPEIEKLNLALEMGNNVLLYLDDIQHTNPELLQKFISLCDATRKIEGVRNGKTRLFDFRFGNNNVFWGSAIKQLGQIRLRLR